MTATLSNRSTFRSMRALTKCVVPMLTASAPVRSTDEPAFSSASLMADWIPSVTSGVVGDLAEARTGEGCDGVTSRRTASLKKQRREQTSQQRATGGRECEQAHELVPPTSTPILKDCRSEGGGGMAGG